MLHASWRPPMRLGYSGRDSMRQGMQDSAHPPVEWLVSRGLVPYETACAVMDARVDAIAAGAARELVWLLEHPPLYTAGTSARAGDLLDARRFPVHSSGRGGQYTYHGPGQRVGYVMLDVGRRFGDVRAYVAALEGLIVDALGAAGRAGRDARRPRRRLGAAAGTGAGRPRQDRGHRRAPAPLGELARLQRQRRAGPRALLGHRALRHRRRRGHQPRPAGLWTQASTGWTGRCVRRSSAISAPPARPRSNPTAAAAEALAPA